MIVAGFQGRSPVTRRSRRSAARVGHDRGRAAALDRAPCEIYTDVDGVFTADPRVVPAAPSFRSCRFAPARRSPISAGACCTRGAWTSRRAQRVPLTVRLVVHRRRRHPHRGGRAWKLPVSKPVAHQKDVTVVIAEGTSGGRGEARGIPWRRRRGLPALQLVAHEKLTEAHGALVWTGPARTPRRCRSSSATCAARAASGSLTLQHDAAFVRLSGSGSARPRARAASGRLRPGWACWRCGPPRRRSSSGSRRPSAGGRAQLHAGVPRSALRLSFCWSHEGLRPMTGAPRTCSPLTVTGGRMPPPGRG